MSSSYVWVDRQYKRYKIKQIDNRYLKNILRFLCRGGGYLDYIDEEKITKLFKEATKRGIARINWKTLLEPIETDVCLMNCPVWTYSLMVNFNKKERNVNDTFRNIHKTTGA